MFCGKLGICLYTFWFFYTISRVLHVAVFCTICKWILYVCQLILEHSKINPNNKENYYKLWLTEKQVKPSFFFIFLFY